MLFSTHVSQALLASVSILSLPVALANPIATPSAAAGLETTSLEVWRPLDGWENGPSALATRQNGGGFTKKWKIAAAVGSAVMFPVTTLGTVKGCEDFAKDATAMKGVLCVGAAVTSAISLVTGLVSGTLLVKGVIFFYESTGGNPMLGGRSDIFTIDNSKRAAPFPAIEAPLIDI